MPFSRGSSQPRNQAHISYVSCIGSQVLYRLCHLGSQMVSRSHLLFLPSRLVKHTHYISLTKELPFPFPPVLILKEGWSLNKVIHFAQDTTPMG